MRFTIDLDEAEIKILKRRAKKNLFSLREQIEDIVRRSCIMSKGRSYRTVKVDDKLVGIFSRERKGRKPKKKKKK